MTVDDEQKPWTDQAIDQASIAEPMPPTMDVPSTDVQITAQHEEVRPIEVEEQPIGAESQQSEVDVQKTTDVMPEEVQENEDAVVEEPAKEVQPSETAAEAKPEDSVVAGVEPSPTAATTAEPSPVQAATIPAADLQITTKDLFEKLQAVPSSPVCVQDSPELKGDLIETSRDDSDLLVAPGVGEDPLVMVVPVAPEREILKTAVSLPARQKSVFKKKREPLEFVSRPAASRADASALRPVDSSTTTQHVFVSKPTTAEVAASALRPIVSPRTEQFVFESRASKSMADASTSSPSPVVAEGRCVFESVGQPSRTDASALTPASPRTEQNFFLRPAAPSRADTSSSTPSVVAQRRAVFTSEASPSMASVRHSDSPPPPTDTTVFASLASPSTADVRADDVVPTDSARFRQYISKPAPSIADVRATDVGENALAGSAGVFVNKPSPSRSATKWDAPVAVKQEKTVFESSPRQGNVADVTWKDDAKLSSGPIVFENMPKQSTADTGALMEVEYESDENGEDM
eukprot:Protomagalhaensia_sp_Gyna_25__916@NODE_1440_length_1833_cov_19_748606_g1164_i0_p1_GENE_NODE_1440_length_1833_cov_19_748606_g1164_i0NODE_1440_length_1833_cov_19_748606_g1164_i0_p1_ORF_typecomplete_len519_score94_27_NODE_1440_length_1833_cov_19_748606_g1164_i01311687